MLHRVIGKVRKYKMSRLELDQIQTQLKIAIQNHQILVSRLQLQPQEMGLKAKLHNLQKDIIAMCQKQKLVVEKLAKDLIEKKPTIAPKTSQVVIRQTSQTKNTVTGQKRQSEVTDCDDPPSVPGCDSPQCVPDLNSNQPNESSLIKNGSTSPLRVPQYPVSRPPVLQNNNSISKDQCVILNRTFPTEKRKPMPSSYSVDIDKLEEQKQLKKKISFMASLDLVPPDTLKEVSGKRSERKRRSTNNPNFAYGFELEKRPRLSNFLASDYFGAKKSKAVNQNSSSESSASTSPDHSASQRKTGKENVHENLCSVCGISGQLLMCDACSCVYHLQCLNPPLEAVPEGHWMCPKCQESQRKSASLAAVNSYISNKTGKEEEKRKLLKRSTELLQEKQHLENRTKHLNELLARQGIRKEELIQKNRQAQLSVEKLKKFVELVQTS